jgi:K+-sensing histidine kinase KdpD
MQVKSRKIQLAFIIFWVLLAYIIAALLFWFIELNAENSTITQLRMQSLQPGPNYDLQLQKINIERNRKVAQYLGEGSIFLLLIIAGAVYIFRSVRRELRQNVEQQNFLMAITHELKTPIAVSKLNLETLLRRKLTEEMQKGLLQASLQETNRLNMLCNNLLLSSQIDAGAYALSHEVVSWSKITQACVTENSNRFPQRKIEAAIADDIFIEADHLLLEMVVNNLIENALKYAPKDKPIQVVLKIELPYAKLEVKDEGPGILEADKEKIFKKFTRLGNEATIRAKGTGLGLFLIKRIITKLKGEVAVIDNEPVGSIFSVKLKMAKK